MLWELAAAEVHSRETEGEEVDGGEVVSERSVFLMGSKEGVRSRRAGPQSHIAVVIFGLLRLVSSPLLLSG